MSIGSIKNVNGVYQFEYNGKVYKSDKRENLENFKTKIDSGRNVKCTLSNYASYGISVDENEYVELKDFSEIEPSNNDSIDDLLNDINEVYDEITSIMNDVNSLDADNPNNIGKLLKRCENAESALKKFDDIKKSASVNSQAVGSTIALGGGGSAIAGAALVGASAIPVLGWFLLGVGVTAIAIGAARSNNPFEEESKINELMNKINNSKDILESNKQIIKNQTEEKAEELIKTAKSELGDILNEKTKFNDISDVDSVIKNIDKITEWQEKLKPYVELNSEYNFGLDDLDKFFEKFENADNTESNCILADDYIKKYAKEISVKFDASNIVSDTEKYEKFHDELKNMINMAEDKKLNTDAIKDVLAEIEEKNQKSLEQYVEIEKNKTKEIAESTTTSTSGREAVQHVGELEKVYEDSYTTGQGVGGAANSYSVNTDSVYAAAGDAKEEAQNIVDECVNQILSSNPETVEEWNDAMLALQEILNDLKNVGDFVDSSNLESLVTSIPEKQQEIIQAEVQELKSQISDSSTGNDIANVLSQLNEKIETYGSINVDTSKLSNAETQIIQEYQTKIDNLAKEFENIEIATVEDGNNVIQDIFQTLRDNLSLSEVINLGALENIALQIPEKQQEIIKNEANQFMSLAESASGEETGSILLQIDEKIGEYQQYGFECDELSTVADMIIENQQKIVNEKSDEINSRIETMTDPEDGEHIIEEINELMIENSFVDTSNLVNLMAKAEETIEKLRESNEETNEDSTEDSEYISIFSENKTEESPNLLTDETGEQVSYEFTEQLPLSFANYVSDMEQLIKENRDVLSELNRILASRTTISLVDNEEETSDNTEDVDFSTESDKEKEEATSISLVENKENENVYSSETKIENVNQTETSNTGEELETISEENAEVSEDTSLSATDINTEENYFKEALDSETESTISNENQEEIIAEAKTTEQVIEEKDESVETNEENIDTSEETVSESVVADSAKEDENFFPEEMRDELLEIELEKE